ncbi:GNAT family N-acetyltransferase [Staphylococcus caeli]|uniref:GNAT family N-acetyltransferase n=1 Tax=Staphylococcus caeli TaxID=2201815 RepID=UPI003F5427EE
MLIKHSCELDKMEKEQLIRDILKDEVMVISSGVYQLSSLPSIVAIEDKKIKGVLTFKVFGQYLEVISLESFEQNRGIGTMLLKKVEEIAKDMSINEIKIITTNDNLDALKFYQKRGYRLVEIITDSVNKARLEKITIPVFGDNGIRIQDEIILKKSITS